MLGVGDEDREGVSAEEGDEIETRESATGEPLAVSPGPGPPDVRVLQ